LLQNDTVGFSSYSEGYQYYAKKFKPWRTSNGLQLRFTLHNHELVIRTKNNAPLVNGQAVEKNEGHRPHIWWMETPGFVHVYRGILPMNRVFFPTSAVCLIRPTLRGVSLTSPKRGLYGKVLATGTW